MSGPAIGIENIEEYSIYLDAEYTDLVELTPLEITTTHEYVDIYGNYHLVGEATNLGEAHYNISLVAGIYDIHGKVVDAADLSLPLETLAPGETVPFDFTFWGPLNYNEDLVSSIESHNIIIDHFWTWSTETGMVNLTTQENVRDDSDEAIYFTGKIINSSPSTVDSAVVLVFLLDYQSGDILATNYDYDYEVMEHGATYDYTIEIPLWDDFDPESAVVNYVVKGTTP